MILIQHLDKVTPAGMHSVDYGFDINAEAVGNSTIAMLHELAHALGGGHGKDSRFWDDKIYEGCFGKNAK